MLCKLYTLYIRLSSNMQMSVVVLSPRMLLCSRAAKFSLKTFNCAIVYLINALMMIFFTLLLCYFFSLFETSQSLFWASFGLVELDAFELTGIKGFTRFWGLLMFGFYSAINVIVLLNLLIAMMSNSYQIISVGAIINVPSLRLPHEIFYVALCRKGVTRSGSLQGQSYGLATSMRVITKGNLLTTCVIYSSSVGKFSRRYGPSPIQ